jgi:hypothetical protein
MAIITTTGLLVQDADNNTTVTIRKSDIIHINIWL